MPSQRPVVFIGPYEHHSNELPWLQSIADVVTIPADADGHALAFWNFAAASGTVSADFQHLQWFELPAICLSR